jgi:hypothetical protein
METIWLLSWCCTARALIWTLEQYKEIMLIRGYYPGTNFQALWQL